MRPFRAGNDSYERSIALDASTIDGITVAVAVTADRSDELEILDSIYSAADGHPFLPFRDKPHELEYDEATGFFQAIIDANVHRLTATTHLGTDGSDPERVEAVQSAVLVDELRASDSLVVLDGDDDKAVRFGSAINGLSEGCPPVTTCVQSELYYPTSLLADLCATHLASQIDHPRHSTEVSPTAPVTKETFNSSWGRAYNSMVNTPKRSYTEPIEHRRAESVSARVHCWFNGFMGGGTPIPHDCSVRPVVQHARNRGFEELAMRLSEI